MADLVFRLTSIFFFSFLIFNAFSWVKLWEDKEYRAKRILIYIRETKRGRSLILGWENLVKILIIFLYFYFFLKILYKIYNREFLLPRISFNVILIILLTLAVSIVLYLLPPLDQFLWMVIIDKLLPFITAFFISIFLVFFDFKQDTIINRAIDKFNKHKHLLTVAIVGSYAKGSTKEFITRILSIKFNVLENDTPFNSALGIAKTILSKLDTRKQVFIVEMEDYKKGDVSEMCNIASPKIAVITGINDEKTSVFGNLDNVIESKYEVVGSLPRDGIVILCGNNPNTMSLYSRIKNKKFIYSFEEAGLASDIYSSNIKIFRFFVSFDVRVFGKKHKVSDIKLVGLQNVENLLPGFFLGLYLGIDFSLIRKELLRLRPLPRTMDPAKNSKGSILINDTYNTHINSIRGAIEYMKLYKGKKILILQPLTELGKNAYQDHLELGKEIGKVCDYLFLTNDNHYKPLVIGIQEEKSLCLVQVLPPAKIAKFVDKNTKAPDIVVFEGREAYNSFSLIASRSILRL